MIGSPRRWFGAPQNEKPVYPVNPVKTGAPRGQVKDLKRKGAKL